jgi:hypothetical protein
LPFSPSDISGLKVWLKADAGLGGLSDGDPISTWADQSGGGHDFTSSGTARPQYKTNIQNSLPAVRFDGSDDILQGGNLSAQWASAATMFVVYNTDPNTGSFSVFSTNSTDDWWRYDDGTSYVGAFRSSRLVNLPRIALPSSGLRQVCIISNSTNYRLWADGIILGTETAAYSAGNITNLGAYTPGQRHFKGDVHEVIIYDSSLSDGDRQSVESYLASKWNMSRTADSGIPSSVSGLKLWLKAGNITGKSDGDTVAYWRDASGNARDWQQRNNDTTIWPLYKTNILNGKPSVRFDGSNDQLTAMGNLGPDYPSAMHIFIVFAPISDTEYTVLFNVNNTDTWRYSDNNSYFGVSKVSRQASQAAGLPSNGPVLVEIKSTGSTYQPYRNGTALTSASADFPSASQFYQLWSMGVQQNPFHGDVFEVLIYDSGLGDTDRQTIEAYLLAEYAIGRQTHRVDASLFSLLGQTKTYTLDSLLVITRTKTHSIDAYKILLAQKSHSIDASLLQRFTKTHSIDSLLQKTLTKTYSLDSLLNIVRTKTYTLSAYIQGRASKTHVIDAFLNTDTTISHSIDIIRAKVGSSNTTHRIDAFVYPKTGTKISRIDSYLSSTTSSDPVDNGSIADALAGNIVRPKLRLSRILNRNMVFENAPTITISEGRNDNSNLNKSLIDGYDRSSMKWAFADSDTTTNGEYRIFPDLAKFESEQAVVRQKIPWISSSLTNTSGSFGTAITFTVQYSGTPEFNMIQIVTDQFGRGGGGIISNADFQVSTNGSSWTTVLSGVSGADCAEPHKLQALYYRDQNTTTLSWTTDQETFINNTDGFDREVVTYQYVRVIVHSMTVNSFDAVSDRARLGQFYEVGAYLWDVGLQDVSITAFNVQEARDTSSQTLSPIGASSANSFSITGTMATQETPFYNTYVNPLAPNNDKFQGALYIAELGFNTTSDIYAPYGYFLADDVSMSAPDGRVNISGRDFSKLLQEEKMPDMVYVDTKLQNVIRDVVQRAGIEKWKIDNTDYTLEELSPQFWSEFYSNDEVDRTLESNVYWTQGQTCWEFLQSLAYADLGAFYFDRDNTFIYKSKEDLLRGGNSADHTLTEEDDLFSFNTRSEFMKNAFTLNYKVPQRTKTPVGIWEADQSILASTALGANISDSDTTIPSGDIADWYDQGYIQIEDEIIRYNDRDDTNFLECDRGWLGTIPAAHTMYNGNDNWTMGGSGTWTIAGGVLTATNNGGAFDTTLSNGTVAGDSFNYYCTITINETPYAAGLALLGQNLNNHYYCVFKTSKYGSSPGATAATDTNMYEIWQIEGGNRTLLKGVPWNKARRKMLTGIPYRVQVQLNDDEIAMFVKETKVLSYTIKNADLNVDPPAKIGMVAKGNGPTVFENVAVSTLPEDKGGETLVFSEPFGESIHEIRKFEATYSPVGDGLQASAPPCWGIRYYLTNVNMASIVLFNPGPFSASIFVRNDVDFPYTIIEGQLNDNVVPESFYLTGYAIHSDLQQQSEKYDNYDSIARYGRQELVADLPWVQSKRHAKKLLRYMKNTYATPTLFLNATVRPNPLIRLGEIVLVNSTTQNLWFPTGTTNKFYLTGTNISFDSSGWHQTVDLRSITYSGSYTDNGYTDNAEGL